MTSPPEERIRRALVFAQTYGSIDGAAHKQWVIDQMVRALLDCPTTDMPYIIKDHVYYRQVQVASAAYERSFHMSLDELLARLVALQPKAQEIWERRQREALCDWEPECEVWLALEYGGHYGDDRWDCGFRVREDEATVWALRAASRTPAAAVQAMIERLV